MSAERDELMRLVQDLPDDQVPEALVEIRRHLQPVKERQWPPAFFAIAPGDGKSIADEADEHCPNGSMSPRWRPWICGTSPWYGRNMSGR